MGLGNNKKEAIKYHTDVEEFIPYAAHFDEETLITKNGELLQTIKLTGFAFESIADSKEGLESLRTLIREALKKNIKTDNYALWLHTIRRQRDISSGGIYQNSFSRDLNEKWIEQNKWRTQFVNELYITIISEGDLFPIKDPRSFINNLFIKTHIAERKEKLLSNAKNLSNITSSVIKDLESFGARKLSIFKKDGVYYSEIMGLMSKIMNLRQEDVPIQMADLSTILPTHTVNFQYSTVLVEGPTGKHFGAVFSVKEYREVTDFELDRLIQLPVNFIIAQSFDFVTKEKAHEAFEDQRKIYELSASKRMAEVSGIKEMFEVEDGATAFGQTQIIITVLEGSVRGLQRATSEVVDTLRDMGVTFVREDLFIENCYWSMMPANFDFIKRQTYMPFARFGGFGALHNFTTGRLRGNKWGNAITTLPTRQGMPYFFNFHVGNIGHTLMVGSGDKKTLIARFLISQAQRLNPKTFIIESKNNSENFVNILGGKALTEEQNFDESINNNTHPILSFVISQQQESFLALLSKIENSIDGQAPCIIVVAEEFTKLADKDVQEKVFEITNRLTDKNAMVIFLSDGQGSLDNPGLFSEKLIELLKTKIILPRKAADLDFKELFRLKEKELKEIKSLDDAAGEFVVKRNADSVVIKLNLSGLPEQKQTLEK